MKTKPRMLAPSDCTRKGMVKLINRPYLAASSANFIVAAGRVSVLSNSECLSVSVADMRKFARWFLRKQRCK